MRARRADAPRASCVVPLGGARGCAATRATATNDDTTVGGSRPGAIQVPGRDGCREEGYHDVEKG